MTDAADFGIRAAAASTMLAAKVEMARSAALLADHAQVEAFRAEAHAHLDAQIDAVAGQSMAIAETVRRHMRRPPA